jgi:zinc protease
MNASITRFTLPNGLLVILKEIHTAPLISHWIWYRVGSRNETPGRTGLSHWVEHMQFKGTPRYPGGVLDKAISRNGGVWNAFTYLDWTAYFETLPADKVELAMQIESDRMIHSLFDLDEFESERTVIISEREGNENEPTFRLAEEVQAAAFREHPYHHEIIGDMADLETIQRDDLYRHYQTYYTPNNAVLAIAGNFETAVMIQRVREYYEPIPIGNHAPRQALLEPDQTGQRSIQVEGPGETIYLEAAYHVPAAVHTDYLALNVMDSLLSGPSDLSIFGAGLSNKTSRLYRALVEKELAVSVFGGLQATIDPYLYNLSIIVHPESGPEAVMATLDQEISRLQETPPTVEELARAVKQARALFAYSTESITNQAAWLGFVEMFADQAWLANYLDRLSMVSPQDVQRVAQTYLRPQNRVLGAYIPTGGLA